MSDYTPALPQEIIDKIVDAAARESKPASTLKALSLASKRHLLQHSRSHLFSRIEIYDFLIDDGVLNMLNEAPHLLKFVRKFVVSLGDGNDGSRSPDLLEQIVDHFERLDTLNLGGSYGGIPWKDFHPSYQSLISKLLSHPLRVLSVFNFPELPLELFKRHSNLQALSVHQTKVSEATGKNLTDIFAGLKEFRLMGDTEVLTVFLPNWHPPSTPMNLVRMFVSVDELDRYGAVWSFIRVLGGCRTLQDISLILAADPIGLAPNMPALNHQYTNANHGFPTFPSLLSLQIDVHVSNAPANEADRIRHELVPRFFATILGKSPQPSLELFGSRFAVQTVNESPDPRAFTLYDGWENFDDVLANPDLYPSLRAVRQSMGTDVVGDGDLDNLKEALPKTSQRCLMDGGDWGRAYRDVKESVEDKMSFHGVKFR